MDKKDIEKVVHSVLRETDFPELGQKKIGKVRDIYTAGDTLILISTDRHSSFDRIIAHIPFKGQVLTQSALFWFEQTKDIIKNHVVESPDPNVIIGKKCRLIPIEVVPRGYITGVTNTSLWTHYQNGERDFGNFTLADGLKKNQKLAQPVLTYTTKSDEHDENTTPQEIIEKGWVSEEIFRQIEDVATRLFERGQKISADKGLILVDTKYEFGLDEKDELVLIDEIHTPDSSRYWILDNYQERFDRGEEPDYFDKEFLRLWFREHCDPYKDAVLPEAPAQLVAELSFRYIQIYEKITGKKFEADTTIAAAERIRENLKQYGHA